MLLRWLIQKDIVIPLTKASNQNHMLENIAVTGFKINQFAFFYYRHKNFLIFFISCKGRPIYYIFKNKIISALGGVYKLVEEDEKQRS